MQTFTHVCSCGKSYTDNDPDLYFCPECVETRKQIALEVDKKLASRPKTKSLSNYQIALQKGKTVNSANGGQSTFVRAEDLGLKF